MSRVEGIIATGDPIANTDPVYVAGLDESGNLAPLPINNDGTIPVAISDPKIDIEDEGSPVTNTPHAIINFTGAGVTATDAGSNRVTVNIPGGGGGGSVTVEDEDSPVTGGPHNTLNFTGSGVTATDAGGGQVNITIPSGGDVNGPGSSTDNAVTRWDGATGTVIQDSNVTIDDSGNISTTGTVDGRDVSSDGSTLDTHVADMNNPHGTQEGVNLEDEGSAVIGGPHTILNFTGAGVVVTDAGSGEATVSIAGGGGGITLEEEGATVTGGPHTTLNFVGGDITVTDAGGGEATITSTPQQEGVNLEDEGVSVPGGPHTTFNFAGAGVVVSDAGGGEATVTISGGGSGFGSEYHYVQNTSLASTTSTSFVNYLSLVTGAVPAGTYRVGVTIVWRQSSVQDKFSARVTLNGSSIIFDPAGAGEMQQEPKDAAADQRHPASGFQNMSLGAGVHTVNIDFRQQGGNTAFIYNAAIEFWRVV